MIHGKLSYTTTNQFSCESSLALMYVLFCLGFMYLDNHPHLLSISPQPVYMYENVTDCQWIQYLFIFCEYIVPYQTFSITASMIFWVFIHYFPSSDTPSQTSSILLLDSKYHTLKNYHLVIQVLYNSNRFA